MIDRKGNDSTSSSITDQPSPLAPALSDTTATSNDINNKNTKKRKFIQHTSNDITINTKPL